MSIELPAIAPNSPRGVGKLPGPTPSRSTSIERRSRAPAGKLISGSTRAARREVSDDSFSHLGRTLQGSPSWDSIAPLQLLGQADESEYTRAISILSQRSQDSKSSKQDAAPPGWFVVSVDPETDLRKHKEAGARRAVYRYTRAFLKELKDRHAKKHPGVPFKVSFRKTSKIVLNGIRAFKISSHLVDSQAEQAGRPEMQRRAAVLAYVRDSKSLQHAKKESDGRLKLRKVGDLILSGVRMVRVGTRMGLKLGSQANAAKAFAEKVTEMVQRSVEQSASPEDVINDIFLLMTSIPEADIPEEVHEIVKQLSTSVERIKAYRELAGDRLNELEELGVNFGVKQIQRAKPGAEPEKSPSKGLRRGSTQFRSPVVSSATEQKKGPPQLSFKATEDTTQNRMRAREARATMADIRWAVDSLSVEQESLAETLNQLAKNSDEQEGKRTTPRRGSTGGAFNVAGGVQKALRKKTGLKLAELQEFGGGDDESVGSVESSSFYSSEPEKDSHFGVAGMSVGNVPSTKEAEGARRRSTVVVFNSNTLAKADRRQALTVPDRQGKDKEGLLGQDLMVQASYSSPRASTPRRFNDGIAEGMQTGSVVLPATTGSPRNRHVPPPTRESSLNDGKVESTLSSIQESVKETLSSHRSSWRPFMQADTLDSAASAASAAFDLKRESSKDRAARSPVPSKAVPLKPIKLPPPVSVQQDLPPLDELVASMGGQQSPRALLPERQVRRQQTSPRDRDSRLSSTRVTHVELSPYKAPDEHSLQRMERAHAIHSAASTSTQQYQWHSEAERRIAQGRTGKDSGWSWRERKPGRRTLQEMSWRERSDASEDDEDQEAQENSKWLELASQEIAERDQTIASMKQVLELASRERSHWHKQAKLMSQMDVAAAENPGHANISLLSASKWRNREVELLRSEVNKLEAKQLAEKKLLVQRRRLLNRRSQEQAKDCGSKFSAQSGESRSQWSGGSQSSRATPRRRVLGPRVDTILDPNSTLSRISLTKEAPKIEPLGGLRSLAHMKGGVEVHFWGWELNDHCFRDEDMALAAYVLPDVPVLNEEASVAEARLVHEILSQPDPDFGQGESELGEDWPRLQSRAAKVLRRMFSPGSGQPGSRDVKRRLLREESTSGERWREMTAQRYGNGPLAPYPVPYGLKQPRSRSVSPPHPRSQGRSPGGTSPKPELDPESYISPRRFNLPLSTGLPHDD